MICELTEFIRISIKSYWKIKFIQNPIKCYAIAWADESRFLEWIASFNVFRLIKSELISPHYGQHL